MPSLSKSVATGVVVGHATQVIEQSSLVSSLPFTPLPPVVFWAPSVKGTLRQLPPVATPVVGATGACRTWVASGVSARYVEPLTITPVLSTSGLVEPKAP